MAVEWLGLGLAVVKIALRLHGESDYADAMDDASGPWRAISGSAKKQRGLATAIASSLRAEVLGQLGHDRDNDSEQEAAVTIATQVVAGLSSQSEALVTALAHPDQLHQFVLDHGGDAARAELVAQRAEPLYDRILSAAVTQVLVLVPTSQRATSAGVAELLRRQESSSAQLGEDLADTRVDVAELLTLARGGRPDQDRVHSIAEALPPYLAAEIADLLDRAPQWADLAEDLVDSNVPARMLQRVSAEPPPWLDGAPGRAWILIGHALASYGAHEAASDAYLQGVQRSVPDPDQLKALAALTLQGLAENNPLPAATEERIVALLADNPSAMAQMLTAARADDPEVAYRLATQLPVRTPREREQRAALLANFLTGCECFPEAAQVLRDHLPAAQGAALHVLLSNRLRDDVTARRSTNRSAALLESIDLALTARQRRRAWRGDAVPAVLAAVEAAWMLDDQRLVRSLVTSAPDGEATQAEAADSRLLAVRALAAADSGDERHALRLAQQLGDFARLRVEAICTTRRHLSEPTAPKVKAAWRATWDAAANDAERILAARGLLMHGETAPGVDDLRRAQPEAMNEIDAIADAVNLRRGESTRARLHRLRRSARTNRHAGIELGYALAQDGQTRAAAAAWSEVADHNDDQRWRLQAAALLLQAGDRPAAVTTAENALSRSVPGWPGRRQAHALAIEASADDQNWSAVASHARQLLTLDESADVRWVLAHALCELDEPASGWGIIHQGASVLEAVTGPNHRLNTGRRLELVGQFGDREQLLRCAVEALRDYRDDEAASAQILGLVYSSEARRPDDHPTNAAVEPTIEAVDAFTALSEGFLKRFPDSTHFRALNFDPEKPEEIIELLTQHLAPRAAAMHELETKVRAGQFPVGALALATDRSYAEIHILRSAQDGTYLRRADAATEANEGDDLASALATQGHAALIDASALHTLTWLSDQVRSECLSMLEACLTQAAFNDLRRGRAALNMRTSGSLSYDTGAERLVATDPDEQQTKALAAAGAELVALGQTLPRVRGVDESAQQLRGDIRPWLGLVATCRAQGLALWADDAVLRDIARSERVPTFGTYAVLKRLRADGVISSSDFEASLFDLAQHRGLDLPVQLERLRLVAGIERWRPDAAALVLTRPAAWASDVAACLSLLSEACVRRSTDPVDLATWAGRAALGLCGSIRGVDQATTAVAAMLARMLVTPGLTPQASRAVLDGTRVATVRNAVPDPWPLAVDILRDAFLQAHSGAECRLIMSVLAADLDQDDQRVVFRALLQAR